MTFDPHYGVSQFAVICMHHYPNEECRVLDLSGGRICSPLSRTVYIIAIDIIIKERENVASQSLSTTSSVLIITWANVVGWFHREKVVLPRGTWNGRAGLLH